MTFGVCFNFFLFFIFKQKLCRGRAGDGQKRPAARGIARFSASEGGCPLPAGGREETAADACVGGSVGRAAAAGVGVWVCGC
jgi:hypothetical protein